MNFTLFSVHGVAVFNSLIAELRKDVQIQQFLILYFIQFFLSLCDSLLEYFIDDEADSVFVDSEVDCVFELCHFLNFQPSDYTNNLIQSFLAPFDRFLDAYFSIFDSMLDVVLDLFEKEHEKIAVFVALPQNTVIFGRNFLEMSDINLVELLFDFLAVDGSQVVREYQVCTLEAGIFHDVQKLLEKLFRFDLSLVQFSSS